MLVCLVLSHIILRFLYAIKVGNVHGMVLHEWQHSGRSLKKDSADACCHNKLLMGNVVTKFTAQVICRQTASGNVGKLCFIAWCRWGGKRAQRRQIRLLLMDWPSPVTLLFSVYQETPLPTF